MSYLDRLAEMIYTAPSGAAFRLRFTDVERTQGKKAPVSEFPNQDQGAVQDLGQSTPRYPVSAWIDGPDYDLVADRFWTALNESGPGTLDHPRYGTIQVLPVSISQTESFVNGAGRATFAIEFVRSEDIALEYPRTAALARLSVTSQVDAAQLAIDNSLAGVELEEPGALAALKDNVLGGLDAVTSAFDRVTGITQSVAAEIQATVDEITGTIDDLVQAPLNLVTALSNLYRLPADVITDVKSKIDGYTAIAETVYAAAVATTLRYGELFGIIQAGNVNAAAIAAADASASGTATTRRDAIDAAETLRALADSQAATIDAMGVDDYESYYATRRALTLAIDALIRSTLDLPAERVYTVPADTTLLELVYLLYGVDGDADTLMDRIIDYNDLTGEEMFIVPQGRIVRWYV
jgi:prophage DNA circulation protein